MATLYPLEANAFATDEPKPLPDPETKTNSFIYKFPKCNYIYD